MVLARQSFKTLVEYSKRYYDELFFNMTEFYSFFGRSATQPPAATQVQLRDFWCRRRHERAARELLKIFLAYLDGLFQVLHEKRLTPHRKTMRCFKPKML